MEVEEQQQIDRISQLPDDLLIRILSRLPGEEVARAKLVSKAWKKLSGFSFVPPLTFEQPRYYDCTLYSSIDYSLKLHYQKGLSLSRLRLHLDLYGIISRSQIDSWIDAALEGKVGQLDLWLIHNSILNYYPLPAKVFSARTLSVLCLEEFRLEIHGNVNIDLPALRKLRLTRNRCDEQEISILISSCPSIRDLEISHCYPLKELPVSGLANLQRLSVVDCPRLERIEVDAPSLQFLRHQQRAWPGKVLLSSREFLTELILWHSYITEDLFQNLISGLPNLERLEINCTRLQRIEISHHLLKQLDITLTFWQEKTILKINTPNLRSLKYNGHRMPFNSIMSSLNSSSLHETEINFIH